MGPKNLKTLLELITDAKYLTIFAKRTRTELKIMWLDQVVHNTAT